jgi:hypothetical protein
MLRKAICAVLHAAAVLAVFTPCRADDNAACEAKTRALVLDGPHREIPPDCWHAGPLRLGMTEKDVEAQIGPPAFSRNEPYYGAVYAYYLDPAINAGLKTNPVPADALAGIGKAGFLIAYKYGRAAMIVLPAPISAVIPPCHAAPKPVRERQSIKFPPSFKFLSIALGDSFASATRKLGPYRGTNASRDFFEYWPLPLEFAASGGAEGTVDAIAFGEDEKVLGYQPYAKVLAKLDPATCLADGFDFISTH